MRNKKIVQITLLLLGGVFFLSGCLPGRHHYRVDALPRYKRSVVINNAKRYIGIKYRYGGITPRGFDCSGYVMYVYKKSGVVIPRSLPRQYAAGRRISRGALRPGDLVFFRIDRRKWISHVGIYMGKGRFLHAPRTGKRVSYASLGNPYWKKHYKGSVTFF